MNEKHFVTIQALSQVKDSLGLGKEHITTRLIIPVNIHITSLRLRFSNLEGDADGYIDDISVAFCDADGIIDAASSRNVTIHGDGSPVIQKGIVVVSDPIDMEAAPGQFIAISIYCERKPQCFSGIGESAVRKAGGTSLCKENFTPDIPVALSNQPPVVSVPYLKSVDAETYDNPYVVACLGDSITAHEKWFKPLRQMMYERFPGKVCLTNYGICGNQLLNDAPQGLELFGKAGQKRLLDEVMTDYGVSEVLLSLGTNDIHLRSEEALLDCGAFVEEMRAAWGEIISICQGIGINVRSVTVYPAMLDQPGKSEKETARLLINQEMKCVPFDQVIDVDPVLKHDSKPGYREGFDAPDHIHINSQGGMTVAKFLFNQYEKLLTEEKIWRN